MRTLLHRFPRRAVIGVIMLLLCSTGFDASAQRKKKKKNKGKKEQTAQKAPARAAYGGKKGGPKPYDKVITKKAESDSGMFTIHKVEESYYFEIPDELLEREILIVSRMASTIQGLSFGGAGMKSRPQQVMRWQRMGDKLLLRSVSYSSVASLEQPIYEAVRRNNFEPIIMTFDIAAYNIDTLSKDTTAHVVKVDGLFTTDVDMIGPLSQGQRRQFGVRRLDSKRSMITRTKSFPRNIEVRHVLTYDASKLPSNALTNSLTVEMNQSMILLPDEPMIPRTFDRRVGYFSIRQYDYGTEEHRAATRQYITKWRLEPKDPEAFARGELVEPVNPIVYYVDPATPMKWRPYIKQGIEDWQPAFEAAGFKNAIIAKDPPTKEEDPEFDPEDIRYSVVRYITNPIQNAQGPHVHDPRTGEILESDILWYHNVMNLVRNWMFVQTAASNPEVRKAQFDDETMGIGIRFVAAHEVGHTLGLPHNFGASSAYPVDSLRSATFTETHGTAPSIMDYARFNYIAQPEDGVKTFTPKIGEYDVYSIMWGYRPVPGAESSEDELDSLDAWIVRHADDLRFRFGKQMGSALDPSSQSEDLGNDPIKASELGVKNLKRIMDNLMEWSQEGARDDYSDQEELYSNILNQWNRYNRHIITNVGGVYENYKSLEQDGPVYEHVEAERQRRAVAYLNDQVFTTPDWIIREEMLAKFEDSGIMDRILRFQSSTLGRLVSFSRLARMLENETLNGADKSYTVLEMMDDLNKNIWSETRSSKTVDRYRRNLQRAYVEGLEALMTGEQGRIRGNSSRIRQFLDYTPIDVSQSDIRAIARGEMKKVQSLIRNKRNTGDTLSRYHYDELLDRIDRILDPKG